MALQIQFKGTGPGQGVFEIAGPEMSRISEDAVELAVQRNADDMYLGPGLTWQTSIHWHWCPRVDTDQGALRLAAGAEIVDGVLGSAVNALLVEIRAGGERDSGILRIHDLVGSPAGAERPRSRAAPSAPSTATITAIEPPLPRADGPSRAFPAWLLLFLVFFGLGLAAVGTAWYLGIFDSPEVAGSHGTPAPEPGGREQATEPAVERAPPEPARTPPVEGVRVAEPGLKGRALVQRYLATNPPASDLYSQAKAREATGDCEAAILLYERAASADPMIAAGIAARYDPATFEGSSCIAAPDPESALVWYEDAARAGDQNAQRRLGQMLVEQAGSGVLHEEGRDWLRKAAAGGDESARRLLEALERP
jgi:hypothetical protein